MAWGLSVVVRLSSRHIYIARTPVAAVMLADNAVNDGFASVVPSQARAAITLPRELNAANRKNRTCESSPGGSGPCSNIRCPSHPHRVHGFTGCVDALLKEHSSGGGASSAAGAARGAGMPGLGGITSMFSGLARGLQRSQQPQGPPAPSSSIP